MNTGGFSVNWLNPTAPTQPAENRTGKLKLMNKANFALTVQRRGCAYLGTLTNLTGAVPLKLKKQEENFTGLNLSLLYKLQRRRRRRSMKAEVAKQHFRTANRQTMLMFEMAAASAFGYYASKLRYSVTRWPPYFSIFGP